MKLPSIEATDLLDPSPPGAHPILGSVRISAGEMAQRVAELPPKDLPFRAADVPGADEALVWLAEGGWQARKALDFEVGEPGRRRLWRPNEFLEERIGAAENGTALDLGCGSGRNSVFLVSLGYRMLAVDHLDDALTKGKDLATRYLEDSTRIEWLCADLDDFVPDGAYDLAIGTFFYNEAALRRAFERLRPGGLLLVEAFSPENRRLHGRPKDLRKVATDDSLGRLCEGAEVLVRESGLRPDGRHTARLILRNPSSAPMRGKSVNEVNG